MRFTGKLKTWNDERGFGFITPSEGGQELFVHVSEVPYGGRPNPETMLSFEVALDPQGKKKAVKVRRVEAVSSGRHRATSTVGPRRQPTFFRPVRAVAVLSMIAIVGWMAYQHSGKRELSTSPLPVRSTAPAAPEAAAPAAPAAASALFRCDGRTHCSQMTSCDEATYFLKNCPGTKMDGDRDGVPCEEQFCR
ncbi:MAG: cold shock domain-containing protein [Ramlibacter sp.]|nr:cold shock domain-containing protein [Ramlibacter sp.]